MYLGLNDSSICTIRRRSSSSCIGITEWAYVATSILICVSFSHSPHYLLRCFSSLLTFRLSWIRLVHSKSVAFYIGSGSENLGKEMKVAKVRVE